MGAPMFPRAAFISAGRCANTNSLRPQLKVFIAGISRYSPLTTSTLPFGPNTKDLFTSGDLTSRHAKPEASQTSTPSSAPAPNWGSFLTHAEVAKRFEEFDQDGDGIITVDECRAAMDRLEREISDGVVRESMWSWDQNQDGVVDYFEFMDHFLNTDGKNPDASKFESIDDLLKNCTRTVAEATSVAGGLTRSAKMELIKSFKLLDLDHDGYLTREELDLGLKTMSPDSSPLERKLTVDHLFKVADKNSDGLIDLYEFSTKAVQTGLYN